MDPNGQIGHAKGLQTVATLYLIRTVDDVMSSRFDRVPYRLGIYTLAPVLLEFA
jgi:hypothetical protein